MEDILIILFVNNTGFTVALLLFAPVLVALFLNKRNPEAQNVPVRTMLVGVSKEILILGMFVVLALVASFGAIQFQARTNPFELIAGVSYSLLVFFIYITYFSGTFNRVRGRSSFPYKKILYTVCILLTLIVFLTTWLP